MRFIPCIAATYLGFAGLLGTGVHVGAQEARAGKDFVNSVGMTLKPIAAGTFLMGQGDVSPKTKEEWFEREWDETPAHKVTISRSFLMGAHEVTNAQYELFDPEHRKLRGKFGVSKKDDEPVTHVAWQQAVDYCAWLSKKEGKTCRLPTEAEWEYACRAGTTTAFSMGDKLMHEQANFGYGPLNVRKPVTVSVGSYPANPWGLHDMHGNVAEWCADWYGPYEAGDQTDPVGRVDGWARVTRGWSYLSVSHSRGTTRYCRSANRSGQLPEDANRVTGFRVVLGEAPKTTPLPVAPPPLHQQNVQQTTTAPKLEDPAKPTYIDFNKPARITGVPKEAWGPIYGAWNHFTTLCVCPNGDVLAVWYSCVQEEGRECAQAASRLRVGSEKWDPPTAFFGVPDCNTHAPVLLRDGKRIYHFFTQSLAGWDDAAEGMRYSDDNGATWSRPRIILTREDKLRMSQPCSAFVARDGKLVLAVDGDFGHRDERIMISADRGQTWKVGQGDMRKAAGGKYVIHPAIVQRADDGILVFLRGQHPMPAFVTKDEGETWEPVPTPFPGISVGQKAHALKLAGGGLLLCSFDTKKQLIGGGTFAALSYDDGKTWPHLRKIDGPGGYMSLTQSPNGMIYLFGSGSRCVSFNEAWLKEGKAVPPADPGK